MNLDPAQEIPFLFRAEAGESLGELLARGRKKGEKVNVKVKSEEVKVAALYFESNPFIIYAGQALTAEVHKRDTNRGDAVTDYKNNKGNHPDPKNVPIGLVRKEDRYKWEFHLHMCTLIASLLQLKNSITPKDFKPLDVGHPICINRHTYSSFVDKKSWGIIHGYLMKKFSVDVYLGPKGPTNSNDENF